jgi:hypothetical protein
MQTLILILTIGWQPQPTEPEEWQEKLPAAVHEPSLSYQRRRLQEHMRLNWVHDFRIQLAMDKAHWRRQRMRQPWLSPTPQDIYMIQAQRWAGSHYSRYGQ